MSDRDDIEDDGEDDASVLLRAKRLFKESEDAWSQVKNDCRDDTKFARMGEQWPPDVVMQRQLDGRPCLTINKMPAFARQIVNDIRQNRPRIKVRAANDSACAEVAKILDGLIRNIETTSDADVAYDTAGECAVYGGIGFFRIDVDYEHDDTFEMGLFVRRIANPCSVSWDPFSQACDSSDWRYCFISEMVPIDVHKSEYPDAKMDSTDFGDSAYDQGWLTQDGVRRAEFWERKEVEREIYLLAGGEVVSPETYAGLLGDDPLNAQLPEYQIVDKRTTKSYEVTHRLLTGSEILKTTKWIGSYIPVVPVWGDEVNVDGKREYHSLIRHVKDTQRMYNYWRELSLDTKLPTPDGWTTMGAVKVGDTLFDDQGKPTKVIGKSPVKIKMDCYNVAFDDGSNIVASGSHVWAVEERGKRVAAGISWEKKKITTAELVAGKHFIDVAKPLECAVGELPVHPYVLGFWLGDGDSSGSRLTPGDGDLDEVRNLVASCGYYVGVNSGQPERHASFCVHGIHGHLKNMGLLGNKHIPAQYLRASEAQRSALLQGLMDSDGSVSKKTGQCSFVNTNDAIISGFSELLRSLGIKAVSLKRAGRRSKIVGAGCAVQNFTQVSFSCYADEPVFRLARKRSLQGGKPEHRRRTKRHRIVSVERVSSVPVQCIGIDAPSHLFLAGEGMVPTHNTTATELVALAPKAPYLVEDGAIDGFEDKWNSANTKNWPYLTYKKGSGMPQRQPFEGVPAGALSEAANASDDMKAILGLFDASLGAKSNETSGIAIHRRMAEGDVSTFHFVDNLNRAIRCAGRILIELIPMVYDRPRVLRIVGEDGKCMSVPVNQQVQVGQNPQTGEAINRVFDLTAGEYDVAVEAGPSYTTQRTESADMIAQIIGAAPMTAPLLAPMLLKLSDFPDNDKATKVLATMMPPAARAAFDGTPEPPPQPPPEVAMEQAKAQANFALQKQKAELDAQLEQQKANNRTQIERDQAQADIAVMQMKAQAEMEIERQKAALQFELKRKEAELAAQLKIIGAAQQPPAAPGTSPGVQ